MSCTDSAARAEDGGSRAKARRAAFADLLPATARQAFLAWRAARRGSALPQLADFAPHQLPPQVMPWVLIQRERAEDGEIVYGLIGDELTYFFTDNAKGRPVLQCVSEEEQAQRMALIRRALDTGMPFWFTGTLLFKDREQMSVGRISLPAKSGRHRVIVVIYFVLERAGAARPRPVSRTDIDARDIHWCSAADLANPPVEALEGSGSC